LLEFALVLNDGWGVVAEALENFARLCIESCSDKHLSLQRRPPWYRVSQISHVVLPEKMLLVIVETSISPPLIYITEIVRNVLKRHKVVVHRFSDALYKMLTNRMLVLEVGVEPDLQQSSDQQLLILARGDSRAFAALYSRHHQHLFAYAMSILHDRDLAEDVAEETFARLISHLGWLASTHRPVLPWMYRVARNRAMDELRRRSRVRLVGFIEIACSDPNDDAVKNIEAHAPEILNAISSLNPFECACVTLRHLEGMATRDVARELWCRPRKVTAALNHAYGVLRRKLSDI
jgi:RNA polymerase sigma factor (sigma-70 family)